MEEPYPTDRQRALNGLAVGDIFHGEGSNGASLVCVVTAIAENAIHARTVTTQYNLEFDRRSGVCKWGNGTGSIDSVAHLPADVMEPLLGLDQRYRSGGEGRLTDEEKRALIFVARFYPANPI